MDRQEDALGTYVSTVSPYLLRPLRSYQEAMRQRNECSRPEDRINASGLDPREPADMAGDDA